MFAPGKLVVMMADTGDEHVETLAHMEYTKKFCKKHDIEFVHITPDMGFHRKSWQGLREHYVEYAQIGSKAFTKSCTESLKLAPMGNFMDDWIGREFGYPSGRKRAIKRYVKEHGHKIVNLIGIAQGEESRVQDQSKQPDKWRRDCIEIRYPLIEFGLDRAGCQDYMRRMDEVVPLPSNCILCPWMNEQELVWLYRFLPRDYSDWVAMERFKVQEDVKKYGPERKNLGVWAKTDKKTGKELWEYKMSHGIMI